MLERLSVSDENFHRGLTLIGQKRLICPFSLMNYRKKAEKLVVLQSEDTIHQNSLLAKSILSRELFGLHKLRAAKRQGRGSTPNRKTRLSISFLLMSQCTKRSTFNFNYLQEVKIHFIHPFEGASEILSEHMDFYGSWTDFLVNEMIFVKCVTRIFKSEMPLGKTTDVGTLGTRAKHNKKKK